MLILGVAQMSYSNLAKARAAIFAFGAALGRVAPGNSRNEHATRWQLQIGKAGCHAWATDSSA